jgi:hypothetical protein
MKPADVLITGFVKSPVLARESLAPLLALRCQGLVRHIHYVTWDSPELDAFVAPVAAIPDVRITRVPQPEAKGTAEQRGLVYQVENLRAGLALIRDDDALVLKTRLDMVAKAPFLGGKIAGFTQDSAVPPRRSPQGITMPAPVLKQKIWIPWADSNQPFFFEDALFMGRVGDIRKLVTQVAPADMEVLSHPLCGPYAHVVRYAKPFLGNWPIFANYLRHYRCFVNDIDYRKKLVPLVLDDGFFWHLLIAHAWILHSQFHVDAGQLNDLRFFANNVNKDADWSQPQTLRLANPYDDVMSWRGDTRPDEATHSVRRVYGRLMDDAWQAALFHQPRPDFPADTLRGLMENIADHHDGRLAGIEREFYARLRAFSDSAWPLAKSA